MSLAVSYTDAEQKIREIDLYKTVLHTLKSQRQTVRKISALIGKDESFVRRQLHGKNVSLPLLYVLTVHLKVNLFEPFLNQLPDNLQSTEREAALQRENEALQKQLAEVQKERDLLERIVMK